MGILKVYAQQSRPNVIIIYADDLGYGDLSIYGAQNISTPNIDKLALNGIKFTNTYATDATCTPSRYSLLTGNYAFRKNLKINDGDAPLLIEPETTTIADLFKRAGYTTAVIGKWHLGLGGQSGPDWNGKLKPGPLELGFDYASIIPATPDRVPTVIVKNHTVEKLDPKDPISIKYSGPIENSDILTYRANPDKIIMKSSHGHDNSLINGIGRIGYMKGGKKAIWDDEQLSLNFLHEVQTYISANHNQPFFLYYATPNIHVPRTPAKQFQGKSGMGARGDSILELDYCVGELLKTLEHEHILQNTLIILSSDNGPVLDDGYQDKARELVGQHDPSAGMSGGKYSIFQSGTRVPFIVSYPGKTQGKKISGALLSQVDLLKSFCSMLQLRCDEPTDSENHWNTLTGNKAQGRKNLITNAQSIALIKGRYKYIAPSSAPAYNESTMIKLGNSNRPQLYNIKKDPAEHYNLATKRKARTKKMVELLDKIRQGHN